VRSDHEDMPDRSWIRVTVLIEAPATRRVVSAVALLLLLSACAAGPNPGVSTGPHTAGFFMGLWHGLILPITFVISLFSDTVSIYEVHNNGHWYDLGFVFGAGGLSLPGLLSRRGAPQQNTKSRDE
jgi:hypothetical protein